MSVNMDAELLNNEQGARIAELERHIGAALLEPTVAMIGETPKSLYDSANDALGMAFTLYGRGDLSEHQTIDYYRQLQPHVTANTAPVRPKDVAVFDQISPGALVLIDGKIKTVRGRPRRLEDIFGGIRDITAEELDDGYNLAVGFDVSDKNLARPHARYDYRVSMHRLADRMAVGEDSIADFLTRYKPTQVSQIEDGFLHSSFDYSYAKDLHFNLHRDVKLLHDLHTHGLTHLGESAVKGLKVITLANTQRVLGLDTDQPTGLRFHISYLANTQLVGRMLRSLKDYYPEGYTQIFDTVASFITTEPDTSEAMDRYVKMLTIGELTKIDDDDPMLARMECVTAMQAFPITAALKRRAAELSERG